MVLWLLCYMLWYYVLNVSYNSGFTILLRGHELMKKIKQYKGFVIAQDKEGILHIFTKEEWSYGNGCRYPEHEAGNIQEALDFIDSY